MDEIIVGSTGTGASETQLNNSSSLDVAQAAFLVRKVSSLDADFGRLYSDFAERMNVLNRKIQSQTSDIEEKTRVLQDQAGKIATLEKKTGDETDRVKKLEERTERISDDFRSLNTKNIETLGIFVALFTFVSVDFQILRGGDLDTAISILLLSAGILMAFVLILHAVISEFKVVNGWKIAAFVLLFLSAFSCVSLGLWRMRESVPSGVQQTAAIPVSDVRATSTSSVVAEKVVPIVPDVNVTIITGNATGTPTATVEGRSRENGVATEAKNRAP